MGRKALECGLRTQVGFQHRFQSPFVEASRLIAEGSVGPLHRANLYATNWFRRQRYFDERPWRAHWAQSGGGIVMSQAIHHLDAFLWLVGNPSRVIARAWSSRHRVEVEDDVAAILEFPNGAKGVFVASTTDAVGWDRLEVHGDLGTLIVTEDRLRHGRTSRSVQSFSDDPRPGEQLDVVWEDVEVDKGSLEFLDIVTACHIDFLDAIEADREATNSFTEASRAIEVANAIYLSAVEDRPVDLPLDEHAYDAVFALLCQGDATIVRR